jgi:pyruvate/2-oxoglutarate dehydrogenase complex dihydrolipoamide dehydrogenase (E3) component
VTKVRVTLSRDGRQQVLEADKVVQAIGFQPRVEGYGLGGAAGFVKILSDGEHGELIGAHLIGPGGVRADAPVSGRPERRRVRLMRAVPPS